MIRILASFGVGFAVGFGVLYLACQGYVLAVEGDAATVAQTKMIPLWVEQDERIERHQTRFFKVSMLGGLACGFLCALRAMPMPQQPTRRRAVATHLPLDREELRAIAHSCQFCTLTDRSPEFVQGLVVGRLAESDPALASKVDRLSPAQAGRLHIELRRRQASLIR